MTSWQPEKLSEFRERNFRSGSGDSDLVATPKTIFTVANAIRSGGVQETQAQRIIELILDSGIVFREIGE